MKTKRRILNVVAGVMLSFAAVASENSGGGVRGGSGHVVDVNATPYLLDLVTRAVCDWQSGEEILENSPALDEALARISSVDWYFANGLEKEIKALAFCMTGPLYSQPLPLQGGSAVLPPEQNIRQAGIRVGDRAYVDSDIYMSMNAHNRAMFIIHEVLHSYLAMNQFDRALKLRSMVKTLSNVVTGSIRSRSKLHSAMVNNGIEFPTTVGSLDAKRAQVLFLIGDEMEQTAMIFATRQPEALIGLSERDLANLAPWDRNYVTKRGQAYILEQAIRTAIENSFEADLEQLLDGKEYLRLNPAAIALGSFGVLSPEQKVIVLSSESYRRLLGEGFSDVIEAELSSGETLVMASASLASLGANAVTSAVPLLDVTPAKKLPAALQWLPVLMVSLHAEGQLTSVTENAEFYRALGLKSQRAQLAGMSTVIAREKEIAEARLQLVSKALVKTLLDAIAEQTDTETLADIKKLIKFEQF